MTNYVRALAVVQPYLAECDHDDHKMIEGNVSLREFLAGMLSYYPSWIRLLYTIRGGFVRLLGMRQEHTGVLSLEPEAISFQTGAEATFFTVVAASENAFWIAGATDQHLTAYIVVAVEPLADANRFHVATIVHYHNWAGPLYFNVIRPFHHVVVRAMMRAGVQDRSVRRGWQRA